MFQSPRFSQLQFQGQEFSNTGVNFADLLHLFVFRPDLNIGATIKALQTRNLLQILAEPNLITLEGKGLNETQLKQLATATKGGFYREEDLHRLAGDVKQKYARFTVRQEVLLWGPLTWALFVGLITAEWIGRKLGNLS